MQLPLGSNAVTIRASAAADLTTITAIYGDAVIHGTASFELEPPNLDEMIARYRKLTAEGYPYLVAEIQGQVVGYAYASAYRTRPAYRATVEDSVYVREDCQGRGIGHVLLERLVAACLARGYRQMIAVIGDSANRASVRVHERLGFHHVGTLSAVGWKHGRWLDTVLMQRALGDGATSNL